MSKDLARNRGLRVITKVQ